jgi:hypothetical protein
MSEPRTLDHAGYLRRIDALDALYLTWDRLRAAFLAFDGQGDSAARNAAYEAMLAAWGAYEAAREAPWHPDEAAMSAQSTPLAPQSQASPMLSCLELRMWCASLLSFAANKSGDIQEAVADETAGSVVLRWQGHQYLVRLSVTATKEQQR